MGLLTDGNIMIGNPDAGSLFLFNGYDPMKDQMDRMHIAIMEWLDAKPVSWVKDLIVELLVPVPRPAPEHLTKDQALDVSLIENALNTSGPGVFDLDSNHMDNGSGDMCMYIHVSNVRFLPFVDSVRWSIKRMNRASAGGLEFPSLKLSMNVTGNAEYELIRGNDFMAGRELRFQTTICATTMDIRLKSELFKHKFIDHGTSDRQE